MRIKLRKPIVKLFKKATVNFFRMRNVHLCIMTDKTELKSLLQKLRPVSCDMPLIRLGPEEDGGYLLPDDLKGIKACFSPGVADVSGFETECASRGMNVFLADNSVKEPSEEHKLFHFTKKHLGVTTNSDYMTFDDWVESSIPDSEDDLLLQIDIEGFEYEVFLAMSDRLLKRFRIIVVEFHGLEQLWNKPFFDISSRVFDKLLQTHKCVHNHPNNYGQTVKYGDIEIPILTELTFLRKDRVDNSSFITTFPHPLDFDNVKSKPSLHLPECWYK